MRRRGAAAGARALASRYACGSPAGAARPPARCSRPLGRRRQLTAAFACCAACDVRLADAFYTPRPPACAPRARVSMCCVARARFKRERRAPPARAASPWPMRASRSRRGWSRPPRVARARCGHILGAAQPGGGSDCASEFDEMRRGRETVVGSDDRNATAPTACEAPTRPVRGLARGGCPAAHQLDATELQVENVERPTRSASGCAAGSCSRATVPPLQRRAARAGRRVPGGARRHAVAARRQGRRQVQLSDAAPDVARVRGAAARGDVGRGRLERRASLPGGGGGGFGASCCGAARWARPSCSARRRHCCWRPTTARSSRARCCSPSTRRRRRRRARRERRRGRRGAAASRRGRASRAARNDAAAAAEPRGDLGRRRSIGSGSPACGCPAAASAAGTGTAGASRSRRAARGCDCSPPTARRARTQPAAALGGRVVLPAQGSAPRAYSSREAAHGEANWPPAARCRSASCTRARRCGCGCCSPSL